jgi:quinoprotein glucose dehydrogenase
VAGAPPPPATVGPDYKGLFRSPIDFWLTSMNLSAIGPPWSQLTAYDLNTGEIKWQVPNGTVAGLPEIPEWKGPTGAHWPRGGPLVTGGGLVFVATGSDRKFRAYDRDNGKVVWAIDIPASSDGVPASYEVDGRQFIVIPVSGLGSNPVRVNGQTVMKQGLNGYIAYALPEKK